MKRIVFLLLLHLVNNLSAQEITDGLVGYWPLDGTATDLSLNQNDGLIVRAKPTIDRFNNIDGALSFTKDSYIHYGDVLDMGTGDFSICAWFKMDAGSSGNRVIISKSDYSSKDYRYGVYINSKNKIQVVFDYGPGTMLKGISSIKPDIWYFVAVTFDRDNEATLYLNGVVENLTDISSSSGIDMQSTWPLRIGEYSGDGLYFKGDLEEISLYNREITSSEVSRIYNSDGYGSNTKICTGLYCENGKVGIGTQIVPENYLLAVDGKAIMEEVNVQFSENWPDFVFDPEYKLSSLVEVEEHIKENSHLADIPSAAEISKNGINVGEMNAKLLQKIEELTLYLIEQNKELRNAQIEIAKLKEKVSHLERE